MLGGLGTKRSVTRWGGMAERLKEGEARIRAGTPVVE